MPMMETTTIRCTPARSPSVCRFRADAGEELGGRPLLGRRTGSRVDHGLHPGQRLRQPLAGHDVDAEGREIATTSCPLPSSTSTT